MSCKNKIGIVLAFFFVMLLVGSGVDICHSKTESIMETAKKYYYGQGAPRNINKAFKLYLKAAQNGHADAMFIVGGLYMQGYGTVVDKGEAFRWLYNAALNGSSSKESQRILGQFFIAGTSVPQNYDEAVHWYELAAKGGDPEAQSELAFLYFSGNYVERDYEKAKYWFHIAAMKGYAIAQYNMGIIWYTGNGVETVDIQKAYVWFSLSAANGYASGVAAKNFLETILSQDELRIAQTYSTELYRKIKKFKQ